MDGALTNKRMLHALVQRRINYSREREEVIDKMKYTDTATASDVLMMPSNGSRNKRHKHEPCVVVNDRLKFEKDELNQFFEQNPGNMKLLILLRERQDEYNQTSSYLEKICISWEIVKVIQEDMNGQFLELQVEPDGKKDITIHPIDNNVRGETACNANESRDDEGGSSEKKDSSRRGDDDHFPFNSVVSWRILSDDECQELVSEKLRAKGSQ